MACTVAKLEDNEVQGGGLWTSAGSPWCKIGNGWPTSIQRALVEVGEDLGANNGCMVV